jgi:hypothetical protein
MLDRAQFWVLTLMAAASAVLVVLNMYFYQQNRALQTEVNSRQQFIQQSVQLEVLYREIAKALADLSIRNQDAEVGDLLRSLGFTLPGSAPGGSTPSAEPSPKGAK